MVSILVITRITTYLPAPKGWKAELAWLATKQNRAADKPGDDDELARWHGIGCHATGWALDPESPAASDWAWTVACSPSVCLHSRQPFWHRPHNIIIGFNIASSSTNRHMVMGECSACGSLYRWTQRSSLQLGLRVGGNLVLTDFHLDDPSELLRQHYKYRHGIIGLCSLATRCDVEIMMNCRHCHAWAYYQWRSLQRLHYL